MHEGTVKTVNFQRGFGFIRRSKNEDIFFHCTSIVDRETLEFGEQMIERRVKFDVVQTARGPQAKNVQPA
jgi:cold shock CspA family protein